MAISSYQLMYKCWLQEPGERPSFVECRETIGAELKRCSKPVGDFLIKNNLEKTYYNACRAGVGPTIFILRPKQMYHF